MIQMQRSKKTKGELWRKIEELLEDCNFHYENGKFQDGEYDEFIKEEK